MILVEIALQNARKFPPKVRLGFEPGLNVVRVATAEQRAMLLDCVYFPLFPDPSRTSATEHLVMPEAASSRVALSLYGRDKIAYRLIRDLATGATRLHRFDAAAKKYELLTEVATEAAQYVRVQQRLPDEVSYERLFLVAADNRPSLGGRARSRSGTPVASEAMPSGSFPSMSSVPGSGSLDEVFSAPPRGAAPGGWGVGPGSHPGLGGTFGSSRNLTNALVQSELEAGSLPPESARKEDLIRELTDLVGHLEVARQAEAAQGELDQLQRRRADLAQRAEVLVRAREQAQALARQLASVRPAMEEIPPTLRDRLEGFEEAEARFRQELSRLDAEMQALGQQSEQADVLEPQRDVYFIGGVGLAVGSLVLALATHTAWIALLNLAGAAVAAGSAFRYVSELEGQQRLEGRLRFSDERRARIEKQYELETAMIRRTMQKLDVTDPQELARRMDAFFDLQNRTKDAEEAVQRAEADPAITGAAQELERVNARIAELELTVMGSAGALQSPEQMQRRITALRRELQAVGVETRISASGNVQFGGATGDLPGRRGSVSAPSLRPSRDDDDDDDDGYATGYGRGSGGGSGSGGGGASASGAGRAGSGTGLGAGVEGQDGLLAASGPAGGGGSFGGPGHYGVGGYDSGGLNAPADRSRDLVQAGADLVQMDVESLTSTFKSRLLQYLGALTDGRVTDCSFGSRGELSVLIRGEASERRYAQMSGEGLDLVDLGLRLALVEAVTARSRIPLIVDDFLAGFPPPRRSLLIQMLGHLSQQTQVIVFSPAEDIPGHQIRF